MHACHTHAEIALFVILHGGNPLLVGWVEVGYIQHHGHDYPTPNFALPRFHRFMIRRAADRHYDGNCPILPDTPSTAWQTLPRGRMTVVYILNRLTVRSG